MASMSPLQERLLGRLQRADPAFHVRWDDVRSVAGVARGHLAEAQKGERPADTVARFLKEFGALFGPPEILPVLRPLRSRTDNQGRAHLEYQQEYRPGRGASKRPGSKRAHALPVYGAKLAAHVAPDGALYEVQSSCWPVIDVRVKPRVTMKSLHASLTRDAAVVGTFLGIKRRMRQRGENRFPIMRLPRKVLFLWKGRFRLAWAAYAYHPVTAEPEVDRLSAQTLELRQLFIDAVTGEILLSAPTGMHAVETPAVGSGRGATPVGAGPAFLAVRSLNVVQIDATAKHRLKDTTHAREIITYDLAGQWLISDPLAEIGSAAVDGTLPVSENLSGSAWNRAAPAVSATDTQRLDSQQPEVEAHFFAREVYEWYDALSGGRAGWDDGQFPDPPVSGSLPIRIATHVVSDDYPVRMVDAFCQKTLVDGRWQVLIFFGDGDPDLGCSTTSADRSTTFLAGSKNIVGHEYQHAVTGFSFQDDDFNPGFPYRYWGSAVHEGLADIFGCLFSDNWQWGPEISSVQLVFRNAVYPRDPLAWGNRPGTFPCSLQYQTKDHFADQTVSTNGNLTDRQDVRQAYRHGTILAHCAYLMSVGGVHQRLSRTPALIPVPGLGHETLSGQTFRKAARIWYDAVTSYLSTHPPSSGDFTRDADVFSRIREGTISSILAPLSYGTGSREHRTTELAFYAVGIKPLDRLGNSNPYYGADVTFLRWGWDWRLSRPYLGGIYSTCPDWASLDLFVNNGSAGSGWNAVIDVAGNAIPFENRVYCRVRNVGDMDATNVVVSFWYAKIGPAPSGWLPVLDQTGAAQALNVGTLGAGQMTFADTPASQGAPPTSAMVKWHIPPLAAGEVADHFCLKAVVTAANDVNPFNNEVQSNVAYVTYQSAQVNRFRFVVSAPAEYPGPIQLKVDAQLPPEWRAHGPDPHALADLAPGEQRTVDVRVVMASGPHERLDPPFDGTLAGQLSGPLSGSVHGALTEATSDPDRMTGRVALALGELGTLVGQLDGRLDIVSGRLDARIAGVFQNTATGAAEEVGVQLEATLIPWRRINVSHLADGQTLGGFTIEILDTGPEAREATRA